MDSHELIAALGTKLGLELELVDGAWPWRRMGSAS